MTQQNIHGPTILLYCCDTWTVTKQLSDRIDAFDMWCRRNILRIPYTRHVTNVEVRRDRQPGWCVCVDFSSSDT